MTTRSLTALLLGPALAAALGAGVRAQEVVAVLSSAPGPYQAAFDSFQKDFGREVTVYRLPNDRPFIGDRTRVVVTFGGEAAAQPHPKRATVIACLAPGLSESSASDGAVVFVAMEPPAPVLLAQIRKVQPQLKRLAVLWNSERTRDYLNELGSAAAAQDVAIDAVRVDDPNGVPDALRSLSAKPDALWLAPDPHLITPGSFQTIKQFSWDNAIPFYAPTAGLAAAGAAAAISVNNEQIGRQNAELARQALSGRPLPKVSFSDSSELTINPDSAAKAGLKLTTEILGRADKVLP
jgi:ABC-type uncharacterized transport system substrate-binding protein